MFLYSARVLGKHWSFKGVLFAINWASEICNQAPHKHAEPSNTPHKALGFLKFTHLVCELVYRQAGILRKIKTYQQNKLVLNLPQILPTALRQGTTRKWEEGRRSFSLSTVCFHFLTVFLYCIKIYRTHVRPGRWSKGRSAVFACGNPSFDLWH